MVFWHVPLRMNVCINDYFRIVSIRLPHMWVLENDHNHKNFTEVTGLHLPTMENLQYGNQKQNFITNCFVIE